MIKKGSSWKSLKNMVFINGSKKSEKGQKWDKEVNKG